MNSWSKGRKRFILALAVFVLVFLIGLPIFFLIYRAPTCSDNKQNGDEAGVDCGGSCQLLCKAESLPLILRGDPRILKVAPNTFEVVTMVENPNTNADIYKAKYRMTLYSADSAIPVKVIEGESYVPKASTIAIFEGPLTLQEGLMPTRVVFTWDDTSLVWRKNDLKVPEIRVTAVNLSREDTNPRIDAKVENLSLENVSNISLVALISNESGTIFAASKTLVDELPVGESVPIVFTWPEKFSESASGINITFSILPDRSSIR